jgi:hypothetical protein
MNWLKKLFGKSPSGQQKADNTSRSRGTVYVTRGGKEVVADEVFLATNSQDLSRMLEAAKLDTNPVDRHFLLQNIVRLTYKNRKDMEMRALCLKYGRFHISKFSAIKPHLIKEMGGVLPRVSTFQHIATVLTEDGYFDEAVQICQAAIELGLSDNMRLGFEGRIKRIKKKQGGQ